MLDDELLRGIWNWTGVIISDGGAIGDPGFHTWADAQGIPSAKQNAAICKLALEAKVDVGLGLHYFVHLPEAVTSGVVSEATVSAAVTRTLTQWIETGSLDALNKSHYHDYKSFGPAQVDTLRHRALAGEAGTQGMILCKNADDILPLSKTSTLAVIGPHLNATQDLLSNYHGENTLVDSDSPFTALQKRSGGRIVGSAYGCTAHGSASLDCVSDEGFEEATALASQADVAIVFVGLTSNKRNNPNSAEGETWDRFDLRLPGKQEQLILAVAGKCKKVVVVLIHGGPLAFPEGLAASTAVLDAHYPGELGGTSIAMTLYGDAAPAGRQTVTTYPAEFVTERNMTTMALRSGRGHVGITYRYYSGPNQFPFGHGLSYARFSLAVDDEKRVVSTRDLAIAYSPRSGCEACAASCMRGSCAATIFHVNVSNLHSTCSSDFVLLGFVIAPEPGVEKILMGFERVFVKAGTTITVPFGVDPGALMTVSMSGVASFKPAKFNVEFGVEGSAEGSPVPVPGGITVTGGEVEAYRLPLKSDDDRSESSCPLPLPGRTQELNSLMISGSCCLKPALAGALDRPSRGQLDYTSIQNFDFTLTIGKGKYVVRMNDVQPAPLKSDDGEPACRDRFLQPFASTSIWNTAIGSGAQYVHAHLFDDSSNSTCVRQPCGPPFSFHNDQDFIIRATESDPLTPWIGQGNWNGEQNKCNVTGHSVATIRFPHDWTSASGGPAVNNRFYSKPGQMNNNAMAVLLPDNKTWVQMQPAYRCTAGSPLLARFGNVTDGCPQQFPNVTSALGDGMLGSHGGSGLSGVGGSIRLGELLISTPPIRHALKLELQSRWYFGGYPLQNSSAYNGGRQQYHWPATGSDGGTGNCLNGKQDAGHGPNCTYSGLLPGLSEGSLLAIPSAVAASVAVNTTVGAKIKAVLTDYGGYISDGTGDGNGRRDPSAAICMDAAVNDEMRRAYGYAMTYPTGVTDDPKFGRELYWDLVAIFRALHVVVNNRPDSIGGGGTLRVPPRPPLC